MAVEKETQLEAWLEENMPEPQSNPNYVETITGTLANLVGSAEKWQLLKQEICDNNATAYFIMDIAGQSGKIDIVATINLQDVCGVLSFIESTTLNDASAATMSWDNNGVLSHAFILAGGSIFDFALDDPTVLSTTLTIIHHPLPGATP